MRPLLYIDDPEKKTRDVTNIGTWGNGNVEMKISEPEEIDYALTIIKQSFENNS